MTGPTTRNADPAPMPHADLAIPPLLFATLLLAMVGPSLTFVTLPPSLPLIAEFFGGGVKGTSIAQGAQALAFAGGTLGGLLAGVTISRAGLRGTLLVSALLYALGGAVAMAASVPTMLFVGSFTVGVMSAFLSSGLAMATGAELTGEARTRMLGFQAATSDIAGITLGLAAGFLAQLVGWRGPLGVYIAFGLVAFVLILIGRPRAVERREGRSPGGMLAVLRLVWPVYACSVLLSVLIATEQIQLPFHLAAHGLTTAGTRTIVQTFGTGAATLGSTTFGFTRARLGERRLLFVGGAAAAIGFSGLALWHGGLWGAAAAVGTIGLAIGVGVPLLFTAALRGTPPELHGYAIGVLNVSIFLGGAISPLIFAPVMAFGGAPVVFAVCALIAALGATGVARMMPASARPAHA